LVGQTNAARGLPHAKTGEQLATMRQASEALRIAVQPHSTPRVATPLHFFRFTKGNGKDLRLHFSVPVLRVVARHASAEIIAISRTNLGGHS